MWNLKIINTDKPFYISIADAIERDIKCGILKPGDKMPTHRELAKTVGVNVTTITRAYQEAEKRGLVTATVGRGTYITADLGENSSLINTDTNTKKEKMIEMGLVLPLYSAEPDIRNILSDITCSSDLGEFMKYIPPQGLYRHRKIAAEWIKQFGINAAADKVIITSGVQHAINCILSSVFKPGDHIAVDCMTYPGIKSAAKRCGISLESVSMDKEGMTPQGLEAVCSHNDIKGIYTVARMQNPTNAIMSDKRYNDIAQIIKQHNLILVEDDLYGFLSPEGSRPLSAIVPEQSIYIAGTSKAFYAGLRIGFIVSPERFYNRISQAVVDTVWMAPPLNAEIVCKCISGGIAKEIINLKRMEIKKRAKLMMEELQEYSFKYAGDSMFTWLKLPEFWSSSSFEKEAGCYGINVYSSDKFTVGGIIPPNYIRVSLSGANSILELERGLEILHRLLKREIGHPSGIL